MHWNTALLPAGSPFVALRKDFERQLGLESSPALAAMTVVEHADRWVVSVDLPGVNESDISITFDDGSLIVEGERKRDAVEGAKPLFSDRSFSKFRRVLKVREEIAADRIDADLANGVLTLTLHRKPEPVPARIPIRTANGQQS
jgi:HSP20 family protein